MIAIKPETTAIEEIVQEQRLDNVVDELLKRGKARSPKRGIDSLTCGETEVDAILSEVEST